MQTPFKATENKTFQLTILCALTLLFLTVGSFCHANEILKMATTTSLQDSGLLDVLLPEFTRLTKIELKVIARGTGAAIRDGQDGNVDILFVHARELEELFVSEGYGIKRWPIMFNDFVIAGPASDPAKISGSVDCLTAMKKLVNAPSVEFISRGDESGTHYLEKKLWKEAETTMPDSRYISIGQGMGRTLLMAFEKQAYVLTDRATLLNFLQGSKPKEQLVVLCQGDVRLRNEYAVIAVNPKKFPHVNSANADKIIKWLNSEAARKIITSFKIADQQVFFIDSSNQE